MATHYVDSAAAGSNNGTNWANAWTSITSVPGGIAAGDTVLYDDGHSQTGTIGTLTFPGTAANPSRHICVDKADDSLSSGATIICNSGAMAIQGHIVSDGLEFRMTANAVMAINNTTSLQRWFNSKLTHTGATGSSISLADGARAMTQLINSIIDLSGVTTDVQTPTVAGNGGVVEMYGGEIRTRSTGTQTTLIMVNGSGASLRVDGVLVSNAVTNLVNITTGGRFWAKRCTLPTFTNLVLATPTTGHESNTWAMLEACKTGSLSVPELGLTWLENRVGTIKSSLSRYRTGGADDGEQANSHSWEMVSNTNTLEQVSWLESPPITHWVDAGDGQTVTVYVASGVTLQDDEFWIEVLSPNETDSPSTTAQGRYQSTRLAFQGTPANLTTDGASTWNGTGVSVLQKISVTINPAVAGPVIVRCCLAKASTTVYVDPILEVT